MSNIPRPKLAKIPGMPVAEKEHHAKDLTKLTRLELLDIKDRESKLLANKAKINRLPDKGKRIHDFYDKVLAELEKRSCVVEAASLFSALNIASQGEKTLNELEWRGRLIGNEGQLQTEDPSEDVIDSDDETEMDPLRLIAQRTMHEKRIKVLPAETQLITAADLEEIKSFSTPQHDSGVESTTEKSSNSSNSLKDDAIVEAEIISIDIAEKLNHIKPELEKLAKSSANTNNLAAVPSVLEPHGCYLISKAEAQTAVAQKPKFLPYKTTISNVHDPAKEKQRKQGKYWEVTAATPPPIQHNGAQLISLLESVEAQTNYLAKLKALQEQQAAERLAAKIERMKLCKLELPNEQELKTKPSFSNYRSANNNTISNIVIEGTQQYNEDDEMHDPLDVEKPEAGITYTIYE